MDNTRFVLQRFSVADADFNSYLDETEFNMFVGMVSGFGFQAGFADVDLDSDEMVTRQEVGDYVNNVALMAQSRILLRVASDGRSLFQLIDENLDRRIGLREFRSAFEKVQSLDLNSDGSVANTELTSNFRLVFTLGPPPISGLDAPSMNQQGSTDAVVPGMDRLQGPRWFVRMDRNRDGDVSLREFPGPLAAFNRADTDSDGLIGLAEAEALTNER